MNRAAAAAAAAYSNAPAHSAVMPTLLHMCCTTPASADPISCEQIQPWKCKACNRMRNCWGFANAAEQKAANRWDRVRYCRHCVPVLSCVRLLYRPGTASAVLQSCACILREGQWAQRDMADSSCQHPMNDRCSWAATDNEQFMLSSTSTPPPTPAHVYTQYEKLTKGSGHIPAFGTQCSMQCWSTHHPASATQSPSQKLPRTMNQAPSKELFCSSANKGSKAPAKTDSMQRTPG
jgi:hypothetical protein